MVAALYAPLTLAKRAAVEPPKLGYTIMTKSGKTLGSGVDLIDCLQLMREHCTQAVKLVRNADDVVLAFTTGNYVKRERKETA